MQVDTASSPVSKAALWTGRVLSTLPVLMLLVSGVMKLAKPEGFVENFEKLGYPEHLALGIAIVELACTLIYVIPQTAVLGAILLTGYLGGATATHVRWRAIHCPCHRRCACLAGTLPPRSPSAGAGAHSTPLRAAWFWATQFSKEGHGMSGIRVLVGTRKGAFVLNSDGKRQHWDVSGPHFGGWEIYHLKGSPADPNRIYASQSSGWFGQLIQRSNDGGKTWEPVGKDFRYEGDPGTHLWYDGTPHPGSSSASGIWSRR